MTSIITIFLFFIYSWGLGFTATYFVKKSNNWLERNLMNLGIGLGVFAILSVILNFFHVPLDWKIFVILSLIVPFCHSFKEINKKIFSFPKIKLTKSNLAIFIVLLIFLLSFYIYTKGAFSYPFLENEDPWGHAIGVKYVALEKTAYDPPLEGEGFDRVLSYVDPYPPAFNVLLGVLHQTSPDLPWTMKFFNALIISLGMIFFYFFVKNFIRNRNKALWATFIFASLPCYLSHFIWAHSLVITLFFPTMYAFEKIKEDKRWVFVAAIMVAGIWVAQNLSQPIKLTTMIFIYLIIVSITSRKLFIKGFTALIGGLCLSFFWWIAMIQKYSFKGFISVWHPDLVAKGGEAGGSLNQASSGIMTKLFSLLSALTNPGGTGSRAYTFGDFFIAKGQNMINNPIGIGMVVSVLVIIGVFFILWKYKSKIVKKENTWLCVTLFWLIFTFWAVNGDTFPISVARGAFRTWMLLTIPVAIITTEGIYFLKNFLGGLSQSKVIKKIIKLTILSLIVIGIFFTSTQQKFELNTVLWPTSGSFTNGQEPFEYAAWFKSIPLNSNVFLYSPRDKLTIGFGAFSCAWCSEVINFRQRILDKDVQELHNFLKKRNYEYFLINGRMDNKYFSGDYGEETEQLLGQRYQEIIDSELFTPVYQIENMFVVFKVN